MKHIFSEFLLSKMKRKLTLSLTSNVSGGTSFSFSFPDSNCLRNSTFFLLPRKCILFSQRARMVSASSYANNHVYKRKYILVIDIYQKIIIQSKLLLKVHIRFFPACYPIKKQIWLALNMKLYIILKPLNWCFITFIHNYYLLQITFQYSCYQLMLSRSYQTYHTSAVSLNIKIYTWLEYK